MSIWDLLRYCLLFFEVAACITGFVHWKKIRSTFWKWFAFYLLAIVCVELAGNFLPRGEAYKELRTGIYSYFGLPLAFLFFFWLFYKYFSGSRQEKWPLIGMLVYVLSWLLEMFVLRQTKTWFFSFSYTVGNVILAVFLLLFFIRFINSEKILGYRSDMMFWVCCGLLIFYLGSLPLYGLWNTIATEEYKTLFNNYWIIHILLDCSMYFFFAIAFVWGKVK